MRDHDASSRVCLFAFRVGFRLNNYNACSRMYVPTTCRKRTFSDYDRYRNNKNLSFVDRSTFRCPVTERNAVLRRKRLLKISLTPCDNVYTLQQRIGERQFLNRNQLFLTNKKNQPTVQTSFTPRSRSI